MAACLGDRDPAGLQREHGERRPGVRDVVVLVVVDGSGEPAARGALVRQEPGDAAADRRVGRRDAGLAEDEDGQAGGVAVAGGLGIVGRAVAALPGAQRGEIPAAVGPLERAEPVDGRITTLGRHQAVEPGRGPEQHRGVVEVRRRVSSRKVSAEPLNPGLRGRGLGHSRRAHGRPRAPRRPRRSSRRARREASRT